MSVLGKQHRIPAVEPLHAQRKQPIKNRRLHRGQSVGPRLAKEVQLQEKQFQEVPAQALGKLLQAEAVALELPVLGEVIKKLGWLVVYPVVEFIRYGVFFLSHLDKMPDTSSEILKRYRIPIYITTISMDFKPILTIG